DPMLGAPHVYPLAALHDLDLYCATDAVGGYYAPAAHPRHPAHTIIDPRYYRGRMLSNKFGILIAWHPRAGSG
ncbi:MAG: hypothetical protein J2P17_34620, partial [Mycobacterium sp.]|nr:hypothetical protein [Mycobacterium sp.]